ncbi:MAG: DUF1569 domain-containing protein [Candidatus Hinthialibacter antarcticus]|nr:DUF1569 domain-containing protein [Candidatus Hinthialibacter antarcticus]
MILNQDNWLEFQQRVRKLQPQDRAQWGSMTPAKMLAHLTFFFESALGKFDVKDESTFFSRNVILFLLLYVMPGFPKNVKAPEMITPEPDSDFEAERAKFERLAQAFIDLTNKEPNRVISHMFFGPMTLRTNSRLLGLHINHHFKQFNI